MLIKNGTSIQMGPSPAFSFVTEFRHQRAVDIIIMIVISAGWAMFGPRSEVN